jgi:hypothetical protein
MQPISVYPTTKTPKRQNVDNTGRNFMRERERERDKTNKTHMGIHISRPQKQRHSIRK